MSQFAILGQGTALPQHSIGVDEALVYAAQAIHDGEDRTRQLKLLYKMTGVERRHTCVLSAPEGEADRQPFFSPPNGKMTYGPSIRERMEK